MGLLDNPYRQTANDAENLAYAPNGGRVKLGLLGIIVPVVVLKYALGIWLAKEAHWLGRSGAGMDVSGNTAQAMAVTYGFIALFSHFRWFWGLIPSYTAFRVGTTISLVGILIGLCASFYFLFQ